MHITDLVASSFDEVLQIFWWISYILPPLASSLPSVLRVPVLPPPYLLFQTSVSQVWLPHVNLGQFSLSNALVQTPIWGLFWTNILICADRILAALLPQGLLPFPRRSQLFYTPPSDLHKFGPPSVQHPTLFNTLLLSPFFPLLDFKLGLTVNTQGFRICPPFLEAAQ